MRFTTHVVSPRRQAHTPARLGTASYGSRTNDLRRSINARTKLSVLRASAAHLTG